MKEANPPSRVGKIDNTVKLKSKKWKKINEEKEIKYKSKKGQKYLE